LDVLVVRAEARTYLRGKGKGKGKGKGNGKGKGKGKDIPGAEAPVIGAWLLSGLKPGPISGARAKSKSKS
jgi:hypothetical protein